MKKLIIHSNSLNKALAKLSTAINSKSTLPVLTNLYCKVTPNQLELISTNTEITIYYRLECEAKETFEFLLPFELLSKISGINKHCPLEIEAGKVVKIKGSDDTYDIKLAEKIADFPKLQELPKKNSFEINSDIIACLQTALQTTGNSMPRFEHVLMELTAGKITIASTDGSFMVFSKEFDSDQQEAEELLLSPKVIKVLTGCENAKVFYHSKAIGFECDNITIINTRTETKFANFRKVFPPDWPENLTIQRNGLIESLEKCSLINDALRTTRMNLENKSEAHLSASDSMLNIKVSTPGAYTGEVKEIAVNAEKLLRLLNQIGHEEISMAINDPMRAIVITSKEDPGYKGMIMPMALTN